MTLAGYIRPFDGRQVIFVLDSSTHDTVDQVTTNIDNYGNAIVDLLSIYDIDKLNLHGPVQYCSKIREDIKAKELAKYSKNKLNIVITQ